jgi:hypothetical protein
MKKITLKIAAIVLLSSVVFFACKKTEVDECSTLPTTLAPEITAATTAFTAYSAVGGQTTTNCIALKTAATALKTKASKCPAVLELPQIKVLITASDNLTCPAK